MDRKDWGIKRICLGCGARFYDFKKDPIVCPTCGMVHDAEYLSRRKVKAVNEKVEDDMIIDADVDDVQDDDIDELDEDTDDGMVPLDDAKE